MSEFFQQHAPAGSKFFRRRTQGIISFSAILALTALAGCGSNYRPSLYPVTGTGPAAQPTSYAFAVSKPSATAQGVGSVIDYSGDTVQASAEIGPGPVMFALNSSGTGAWTLNVDGTVSNIPVSTSLQAKQITYSTLNPLPTSGIDPVVSLFGAANGLYALDVNANAVDVLTGSPDAFKLTIPLSTAAIPVSTPVTMVGATSASRLYAVSQNIPYSVACNTSPSTVGVTGIADAIDTGTDTVSAQIPLGVCPVYGVATPDLRRVFVLNRGSDTVTVINSQNNTLDQCVCPPSGCTNQNSQSYTCHPNLPLSLAGVTYASAMPPNGTSGMPKVAGPVYAEYNPATEFLVIADYDGNAITMIDVSLDEYGNDSSTFGTTYTVPVGYNPASVTVLADGSRAYVANQSGDPVNGTANGSVSIVLMASHKVENPTPIAVMGHPRTVVSTQNSNYGKVYVLSPDSQYLTIVRTDEDIISTAVLLEGYGVDVRITSTDGLGVDNANLVSRLPGGGQPCNLPPSAYTGTTLTIANCQIQQPSLLP